MAWRAHYTNDYILTTTRTLNDIRSVFDRYDSLLAGSMQRRGILALRISLAIIFIWFGALKPMGISAAAGLVVDTVSWMPFFEPDQWVTIIGCWEVLIGLFFLHTKTIRIAIALLGMQMLGTFLPLVILPGVTFQPGGIPFAPTIEGQYIIKNLVIIAAAIVIGGTVRRLPAVPGERTKSTQLGTHGGTLVDTH